MNYNTKYVVRLTEAERAKLESLVKTGKVAARKRQRAHVLLKADAGREGWELPTSKSPKPWTLAPPPSIASVKPMSKRVSTKHSVANRLGPDERESWMGRKRRTWWRWLVGRLPKAAPAGPFGCWRPKQSSWKSSIRSAKTRSTER